MEKTIQEEAKGISSFELSKTAKGNYSWKIKIYNEDLNTLRNQIKATNEWAEMEYGEELV